MSASKEETNIDRVMEVTGAKIEEAKHLLAACNNDVEAAVALFFGGEINGDDGGSNIGGSGSSSTAFNAQEEDDVRAPIAPVREQLVGPEDDNFFGAPSSVAGGGGGGGGRLTRGTQRVKVKVCPLRDFAREGALMEEQLAAAGRDGNDETGGAFIDLSAHHSTGRRRRARAAAMVSSAAAGAATSKAPASSRLGDLFRPPTDIAYAGPFQAARMRATELKHWLLVNVQSDNFNSQLLNRDVWADREVRKLICRQFMLWQIESDSSEGRRFVAFYHCSKLPYVCVIDPRTGEEVWKSAEPKQSNVLPDLKQFLRDHNDFSRELEDDVPSTSKRSTECITIDDDNVVNTDNNVSCSAPSDGNTKKRIKLLELSEEEQLALAIRNSMKENGKSATNASHKNFQHGNDGDDDDDDGDANDGGSGFESIDELGGDDETKSSCERTTPFEERLGSATNEMTALKLRLLNTDGIDEMVQLRWPSDTQLNVLRMYIAQRHTHIPTKGYKLICAFPRKTLDAADDAQSLKELGLHPSANLHVTLDD